MAGLWCNSVFVKWTLSILGTKFGKTALWMPLPALDVCVGAQ
jgi:hypothetical protein